MHHSLCLLSVGYDRCLLEVHIYGTFSMLQPTSLYEYDDDVDDNNISILASCSSVNQ